MIIEFTIKEYREFLRISQEEMAEKLGISQAAYSKIESSINTTKNERYSLIAKILDLDIKQVKNNKVQIIYFVCRDNMNCTENEKLDIQKALKVINKNIEILRKIYDQT